MASGWETREGNVRLRPFRSSDSGFSEAVDRATRADLPGRAIDEKVCGRMIDMQRRAQLVSYDETHSGARGVRLLDRSLLPQRGVVTDAEAPTFAP